MVSKSIKSISTALAIGCAVFAASAGPSQAGLIHDLSTSFGSGQIEFDDLSGNDTMGVVAFSFTVIAPAVGAPQSYSASDISSLSWSVDDSWSLALELATNLVPFGADVSAVFLSNVRFRRFEGQPCSDGDFDQEFFFSWSCRTSETGDVVRATGELRRMVTEAVHIPEPAAVGSFLLGIAGLGLARRHKVKKLAA